MDCVPGIPTQFWFTPVITTDSMRKITGNPKFDYELACAELCGASHWNMRKVLVVETADKYNKWVAEQKPVYTPEAAEKERVARVAEAAAEKKKEQEEEAKKKQGETTEGEGHKEEGHKEAHHG